MKEYSEFINVYARNYGSYKIRNSDLHYYVTYLLANFCMPTLLKIKPSSLIHVNKHNVSDINYLLTVINHEIKPFYSQYTVLYENDIMLILLIYNREQLRNVISEPENEYFLVSLGYVFHGDKVDSTIDMLKHRYKEYQEYEGYQGNQDYQGNQGNQGNQDYQGKRQVNNISHRDYPHEIGLILGFPIQDVRDFIKFHGTNYLFCGYWKVYHNMEDALQIFESYRAIRENTIRNIMAGKKLQDILNNTIK